MELYLNCASDYSIRDETGKKYTPAEAKQLCESGNVSNHNLGFQRLIQFDFDIDAVKKHYQENPE